VKFTIDATSHKAVEHTGVPSFRDQSLLKMDDPVDLT
jgi:hypothetical protein